MMAPVSHPASSRGVRLGRWRRRLLAGCALGTTLGLAVHADRASAQAFNGNPFTQAGSVGYSRSTPGEETITVNTPTAIIGWFMSPPDPPGPNVFLPVGNTATFTNGSGTPNFAVLNRIFPSQSGPVQFDGTVIGQLSDVVSGANLGPGGTLVFQSSGGIILGATAVFDVGNLVLTTLSINGESGYGDFRNSEGGLDFSFAPDSESQIVTELGARIRAAAGGSYVVMAAPNIVHGGSAYVNGSTAYIGALSASYRINAGLFDIEIFEGSRFENPIEHTGTTGGPASTGVADPHRIYMVTAPRFDNEAVTMLLSGSIGFDEATSASIENGQIVLSAGFNIENGALGTEAKYAEANIQITGGTFTSDVFARATNNVIAESDDTALSFSSDLTVEAFREARLSAVNGAVAVGGNVSLTAYGPLDFPTGGVDFGLLALDVTAGEAAITAENGQVLTISGDAALNASAVGDFNDIDGVEDTSAGFGQGGETRVEVAGTGGQITFEGNLAMLASGTGAADSRTPDTGGDGFGGSATVSAAGGDIVVNGGVAIDLRGTGTGGTTSAGQGSGGNVSIEADGGDVRVAGATTIDTRGTGGAILGTPAGGTVGGQGTGGFVTIAARGGDTVNLGTSTTVDSRGLGGTGAVGGAGNGGGVTLLTGFFGDSPGGRILAGTTFAIDAGGTGGAGLGGNGGAGTGGSVTFSAVGPGGLIGGSTNVTISSDGTGGAGGLSPAAGLPVGGAGTGGNVMLSARTDSGAIQLGNVSVSSVGTGGAGLDGGAGTGGDIFAGTEVGYGATGVPSSATFGNLDLRADGKGGLGNRNGGAGTGGSARIEAQVGQVAFGGTSNLSARGTGGASGVQAGGTGQGGSVGIRAATGRTVLSTAGNSALDASGIGGQGGAILGTGGLGRGGTASIDTVGGTLTLSGSFALSADGTGGVSSPSVPPVGIGGNGQGGQAYVQAISTGQITLGGAALSATGTGGAGIRGGDGTGGRNEIAGISGGRVTAGNVTAAADGIGGEGRSTQNGGAGTGGLVRLVAEADNGALALGNVTATARGTGGAGRGTATDGGRGGAGTGGTLFAGTELGYGGTGSTATASFGNISLDATGTGGAGDPNSGGFSAGSAAGAGTGGSAQIQANVGQVTIGGGSSLIAQGRGGGTRGTAANGTGGTAGLLARAGTTLTGSTAGQLRIDASGFGTSGNGTGGTAFAAADGGTIALTGDIAVRSDGTGGDGGGLISGGAGTGGLARVAAFNGGAVSFANAVIGADGIGGVGGAGGVGRAGNSTQPEVSVQTGAFLVAQGGTITGTSATVTARGFGGDSAGVSDPLAARSDGGDGFGGTAQIVALNAGGPSSIDLAAANVDISAEGGDGATSYSGGDATAGVTGVILATTLGNSISIDDVTLAADARGGRSGGAIDSLVGNGGSATAGFVQIGLSSGPGTGATSGNATFGTIQGSANAVGGAGVANGSNGGNGTGGAVALLARGGTLDAGNVTFTANGTGGAGGAGAAGGAGTGGEVVALITPRNLTTDGADATVGAFVARSIGTGGAGGTAGASAYGRAFVDIVGSTAEFASIALVTQGVSVPSDPSLAQPVLVRVTDGSLAINGALEIDSASVAQLVAVNGTIDADSVDARAVGTIVLNATGSGQFSGGAWALDAGADIGVLHTDPVVDSPTINVASLSASAGGDVATVPGTVVRASTSLLIDAAGTASLSGSLLGGAIGIRGNDINVAVADGASVDLDAVNVLTAGDLTATGDVTFVAGGAASFDSVDAGGRFAGSATTLTVPDASAAVIQIAATGGTADLGSVTGTTSLTVNATGNVNFASLTGGAITVASSGGAVSGNAASGTTVAFDAAQLASFSGAITGREIRVTSRDIAIGASARLGNPGTELVRLTVRSGGQQAVIGGATQGPGYTLTNAEAGRVRTAVLEVSAPQTSGAGSRPADLVVRDLSLNATPTPTGSGVGSLRIALTAGEGGGSGILSVEGALAMSNAGASNSVALIAPGGRVQIVNPQGSIRVLGGGGQPGGNLEIQAANIWSASQSIIDQLIANPTFAGRDDALRANNGTTAERGYLEGGEILLRVGSSLLVQNSGTTDRFAGITVVQNTLTIEPTSSGQLDVLAFGRRINADGTFVVNSPYFREVEFGDRARYLAAAEFNDCTIATGFCAGDVPPGLPVGSEIIEGPIEETEESVPPPNPDRQEFVDVSFATESLLEEPVTSGGDSGVWDGEDGDCPPGEVCEPSGGGN